MIVKVALTEDDFLTHLLYSASKNSRSKANRLRSWLVVSGCFFIIGFLFKDLNTFYCYYFAAAGVISLIFYPFYQRYAYKKHYRKFLLDKLSNRIGKECIIDFQQDIIQTKDVTGESKINTSEVSEINEIGTHYFVRLNTGDALVIPKSAVATDSFVEDLLDIFQNPEMEVTKELDWRWK
ncbi:hypothetical protein [Mucilaginibacter sp.]|uniref:hypothetical protein n=1 Tax=Mucilaginibacter sp. TaxID=1882438 RepID=UPI00326308D2